MNHGCELPCLLLTSRFRWVFLDRPSWFYSNCSFSESCPYFFGASLLLSEIDLCYTSTSTSTNNMYIYIYIVYIYIRMSNYIHMSIMYVHTYLYTKAKVYIPILNKTNLSALEDGPDGLTSRELSKDLSNRVRRGSNLGNVTHLDLWNFLNHYMVWLHQGM